MNLLCRSVGVVVLIGVAALSGNSQETRPDATPSPTPAATTNQTTTTTQTTTDQYVFPSNGERFKRYVNSSVGPFALFRISASAGISQWRDSPEEWGQGGKGYGRRWASGFGRNLVQQTVTYGMDEAFDLDTGFEKSKREGFGPRLKDALIQNVTSRTRSGKRVISAPRFVGVYTAGIVAAETWYPDRYNVADGLKQGTTTLLVGFGINVLREFIIRR
ncbi:MAG TPA: hypothetical protein VFR78_02230 [Pyrinomonadaceae bacterium]|nr:hypothetical protein [Pyrinomonadaceae bacterium]